MDKGFANFKPIKDAVMPKPKRPNPSPQRIEVQDHEYNVVRKTHSVEDHYNDTITTSGKQTPINIQSDPHLLHGNKKHRNADKYLLTTPNVDNYHGYLKIHPPEVVEGDHEILGGYDDESRSAQLRKIYENDE